LVLPGSRARIVRCGGRYDPQLVKRSSEWVSDCCFYSSVPAEAVTIAILKDPSFHSWCCLMNRKVKSFKQRVFLSEQYAMSKVTIRRAVFRPRHTVRPTLSSHWFIALSITRYLTWLDLFAVSREIRCLVRQVTTVAMATTQLVLSQF